jgi:hypothetical protein
MLSATSGVRRFPADQIEAVLTAVVCRLGDRQAGVKIGDHSGASGRGPAVRQVKSVISPSTPRA